MYRIIDAEFSNFIGFSKIAKKNIFKLNLEKDIDKNIFLIFGENGIGKTTLLELLTPYDKMLSRDIKLSIKYPAYKKITFLNTKTNEKIRLEIHYKDETHTKGYIYYNDNKEPTTPTSKGNITEYKIEVEKIFGEFEKFKNSLFLQQGVLEIVKAKPSERIKIINNFLNNLDIYDNIKKEAINKIEIEKNIINNFKKKENEYKTFENRYIEINNFEKEFEDFNLEKKETKLTRQEKKLLELKKEELKKEELKQQLLILKNVITQLEKNNNKELLLKLIKKIDKLEEEISKIDIKQEINLKLEKEVYELLLSFLNMDKSNDIKDIFNIEIIYKKFKKYFKNIINDRDNISKIDKLEEEIKKQKIKIKKLVEKEKKILLEKENLEKENLFLTKKQKTNLTIEEIKEQIDKIKEEIIICENIEKEKDDIEKELEKINFKLIKTDIDNSNMELKKIKILQEQKEEELNKKLELIKTKNKILIENIININKEIYILINDKVKNKEIISKQELLETIIKEGKILSNELTKIENNIKSLEQKSFLEQKIMQKEKEITTLLKNNKIIKYVNFNFKKINDYIKINEVKITQYIENKKNKKNKEKEFENKHKELLILQGSKTIENLEEYYSNLKLKNKYLNLLEQSKKEDNKERITCHCCNTQLNIKTLEQSLINLSEYSENKYNKEKELENKIFIVKNEIFKLNKEIKEIKIIDISKSEIKKFNIYKQLIKEYLVIINKIYKYKELLKELKEYKKEIKELEIVTKLEKENINVNILKINKDKIETNIYKLRELYKNIQKIKINKIELNINKLEKDKKDIEISEIQIEELKKELSILKDKNISLLKELSVKEEKYSKIKLKQNNLELLVSKLKLFKEIEVYKSELKKASEELNIKQQLEKNNEKINNLKKELTYLMKKNNIEKKDFYINSLEIKKDKYKKRLKFFNKALFKDKSIFLIQENIDKYKIIKTKLKEINIDKEELLKIIEMNKLVNIEDKLKQIMKEIEKLNINKNNLSEQKKELEYLTKQKILMENNINEIKLKKTDLKQKEEELKEYKITNEIIKEKEQEYFKLKKEIDKYILEYNKNKSNKEWLEITLKEYKEKKEEFDKANENLYIYTKIKNYSDRIKKAYVANYFDKITNNINTIISNDTGTLGNLKVEINQLKMNKFDIVVHNKEIGEKTDISLLSGAEQATVARAIYFSLASYSNFGILWLDEYDGMLSKSNKESFVSMLDKIKELININQIFIISHNEKMIENVDSVIYL